MQDACAIESLRSRRAESARRDLSYKIPRARNDGGALGYKRQTPR